MSSIIRFTPLLGAITPSSSTGNARNGNLLSSPYAFLLEVDDFTFLLDAGWNDAMDDECLANLMDVVPTVDAILIRLVDDG